MNVDEGDMRNLRANVVAKRISKLVWDQADDEEFLSLVLPAVVRDITDQHGEAGARAILRLSLMDIAQELRTVAPDRAPLRVT